MPQLDKVTFLSQYFWLLIFFWGFYVFVLKAFLPEMSRILKFRKKRFNNESAFSLQEETNKVQNSVASVVERLLNNEKNVFKNSQSNNDSWFSGLGKEVSRKNLERANVKYVGEIAEKSLSNSLTTLTLHPNFSEKMLFNRLSSLLTTRRNLARSLSSSGIVQQPSKGNKLSTIEEKRNVPSTTIENLHTLSSTLPSTLSSKSKKGALEKVVLRPLSKIKDQTEKKEGLSDSIKNEKSYGVSTEKKDLFSKKGEVSNKAQSQRAEINKKAETQEAKERKKAETQKERKKAETQDAKERKKAEAQEAKKKKAESKQAEKSKRA